MADDESRFAGVSTLGVDEHVWHHNPHRAKTKGPAMLTGMVDLTRDEHGRTRARLLDLVPGRTGKVFGNWLTQRGPQFCRGIKVATLDPFRGYANAIDEHLDEAAPVLDEARRRVQQTTLGHRGRAGDPLFRIRNILRRGIERLSPRQGERLDECLAVGDPDHEVQITWACYQDLRSANRAKTTAEDKTIAEKILQSFHTCPVPEIARLGRTLRRWKPQFLGYFTNDRANNGAPKPLTESSNYIDESPAASAIDPTAGCLCFWSQADCSSHRNSEEPIWRIKSRVGCVEIFHPQGDLSSYLTNDALNRLHVDTGSGQNL